MKNDLPRFNNINPENIADDLSQLLDDNRTAIDALLKLPHYTWQNFMAPLEDLNDKLNQFWAPVGHLNSVINSPELRKAYNACLPKLSDYATALSHNEQYYNAVKSIAESETFSSLSVAEQKAVENELRDFKLAGVALPADKKKQFAALTKKLSQLTTKFEENVLDATQAWTKLVEDKKTLAGLPAHAIQAASNTAKKQNKKGWLFTLEIPSYLAVMTYADMQSLREEMYNAFVTRASDQGPNANQWDNTKTINEILTARFDIAGLLDFQNYAQRSLATKMVKEVSDVLDFIQKLVDASLEKAKTEFEELKAFAKKHLNLDTLNAWDIAYASEKLRQDRYAISQEDLRPFFPEYKVVAGLFSTAHKLFDITIKPVNNADTWHPDAKCYAVYDASNTLLSYFYTDLYARENKRGGAWMDECRVRRRTDNGSTQIPIAFITCNFNAPIGDDPALFTHDEVITLFHEFGHSLQHMLTKIDCADVSGINGVPWDAVEIASQFLEHWAWEKASLQNIAEHYKTKAPIPDALFEKMLKAKNFQSALQMLRQLEFALFDFRLHIEFDQKTKAQVQKILNEVRQQVTIIPAPEFNRFQHSFSHIFAGGYAAGYYSYKWAEVMASDAFSLFKEKGIFNKEVSQKFLQTFLESGGAKEPMDLFIEFRGRKPDINALLNETGINE